MTDPHSESDTENVDFRSLSEALENEGTSESSSNKDDGDRTEQEESMDLTNLATCGHYPESMGAAAAAEDVHTLVPRDDETHSVMMNESDLEAYMKTEKHLVLNNANFYLTKNEFSAPKARNVVMGGTQVIGSPRVNEDPGLAAKCPPPKPAKDPRVARLRDKSNEALTHWTHGMVKMSVVEEAVKKIESGQNWIMITGNAGDGKTTAGYMVLKELKDMGKEVFTISSPEQYHVISENVSDSVIMLNVVFGAFTFDQSGLSTWQHVIHEMFDNLEKYKKSGLKAGLVLFVSRRNVLEGSRNLLRKYEKHILSKDAIIDMSVKRENDYTERMSILQHCLDLYDIADVTTEDKTKVASGLTPHGFPHCCKMYTDLRKQNKPVDIVEFFSKPILFLNESVQVLMQNPEFECLFKTMLDFNGTLHYKDLKDKTIESVCRKVVLILKGSYVKEHDGDVLFTHPSIYESVAVILGKGDPTYIIKHCSLSLLLQKVHIGRQDLNDEDDISIPDEPVFRKALLKRFSLELLRCHYDVFKHLCVINMTFARE